MSVKNNQEDNGERPLSSHIQAAEGADANGPALSANNAANGTASTGDRDGNGAEAAPRKNAVSAAVSEAINRKRPGLVQSAQVSEDPPALISMARYLAWIFLLLIVGLSIFLSLMIGNNARQVLMNKQYEFAALLSDNLSHQIYRRFTLPTVVGFGRIALRQPAQYERLDQLVRQVIHGMNVQDLRIYDHSDIISYTINTDNLGRGDLASPEVKEAITASEPIFRLDSASSMLSAFFQINVEPGTFILRTTAPLRIENRLSSSDEEGPVMGVLEFRQDITGDMISLLQFQRSIIAIILVSSLLIFMIMVLFLRRAEKALAARVAEKERLLQQLHQSEKLAGMGRVIAGIAHEIRNPLGIICSSSQLLLRRTKDTDKSSAGILQAIYDESHRLSQTVTDFLDYAKPKEPRRDQVDLLGVLQQALIFMGPELEKNAIRLESNAKPAGIGDGIEDESAPAASGDSSPSGQAQPMHYMVSGDKDLLYRAVYNVLINAVQAISDRNMPQIQVSLDKISHPDFPGKAVEVLVADNGSGFASEDLDRFLDPFYTTKPLGSGLGLPIVSSIITSHGGILEIMNRNAEPGQEDKNGGQNNERQTGAVVRILLPAI